MRVRAGELASLVALSAACTLVASTSPLDSGCPADQKNCGGACVSRQDPRFGCARTTCAPCVLDHIKDATCGSDGDCAIAACDGVYANCNGNARDGCESNIEVDANNCGRCGTKCEEAFVRRPHVVALVCRERSCEIGSCESGFLNCNGVVVDGCEVDSAKDPAHCGACARACGVGEACVAGTCR